MTQRTQLPAGQRSSQRANGRTRLERQKRLIDAIAYPLEQVFYSVERLRRAMLSIVVEADKARRSLRQADLLGLRPSLSQLLQRHEGFAAGAGVVLAPGVLADAPLWIEWCEPGTGSGLEQLVVDLDPDSPEFYDYTTTEWYREPQRTGQRHIAGPYVDYICTHEYTFTLSTPLVHAGRFIGIAGADILAQEVERVVLPGLAGLGQVAVLASSTGRVISSNITELTPGMSITRQKSVSDRLRAVGPSEAPRRFPLPWVLLVGQASGPDGEVP